MNKIKVHVSEFLREDLTTDFLFENLKTNLTVVFEDGELDLTSREIIFNSVIWDIFKKLPNFKIYKRYSITEYYVNGFFNDKSLKKTLEVIFKDITETYVWNNKDRSILNDYVYEKFQNIYNDIYNKIICNSREYSLSLDITDFTEIQLHKDILKNMVRVKNEQSHESIDATYSAIKNVLGTDSQYENNPVSVGYRSGSFNPSQLVQVLGPRGFGTELNFTIFKKPIVNSFTIGLQTIYEEIVESKASARSLYLSHVAIEQSEYFARLLQLICMRVTRLVDGDCGSQDYLETTIEEDSVTGKPELKFYVGKVYLDEETNTLKTITKDDTHLYGKKIKIRSPIHCKHTNAGCICMTCFGLLSVNVPYKTNLGHLCSTSVSRDITQKIMSNKHLISSAVGMKIVLEPHEAKWFSVKNDTSLLLNYKNLDTKKYKYELVIPQYEAKGLLGLSASTNIDNIISDKISRLDECGILVTDKAGISNFYPVTLSQSKSIRKKKGQVSKSSKAYGYFSTEFIKYIVNNGKHRYRIDNITNDIHIDLNEWKENSSVVEYISLEYNFLELTKEMKSMVRTLDGENKTPERFISEIFNLLNFKLDVNIALIEVIICAMIMKSKDNFDYHLGKANNGQLVKLPQIITSGSVSALSLFEGHDRSLFSPMTFRNGIPDHNLDVLFTPLPVIDLINQGKRG